MLTNTPTKGSPAVDQFLAAVRDVESRAERPDGMIVPSVHVEATPLAFRVRWAAHTATGRRVEVSRTTPVPYVGTDPRPVVKFCSDPTVDYVIEPAELNGHVKIVERVGSQIDWADGCDLTHEPRNRIGFVLAAAPPTIVAVAVCGRCVRVHDLRRFLLFD